MSYPTYSTITITGTASDVKACVGTITDNTKKIGERSFRTSIDGTNEQVPTGRAPWVNGNAVTYDASRNAETAILNTETYDCYPFEFLEQASQKWPDLSFVGDSSVSFGESSNSAIYTVHNGELNVEFYREHIFLMMTDHYDGPLHHWEIRLTVDVPAEIEIAIKRALVQEQIIIGDRVPSMPLVSNGGISGNSRFRLEKVLEFIHERFPDANISNEESTAWSLDENAYCLLYTSPSPRDLSTSRMPSSA